MPSLNVINKRQKKNAIKETIKSPLNVITKKEKKKGGGGGKMPLMRKIDYFLEGLLHFPFLRFGRMTLHPKYELKKKILTYFRFEEINTPLIINTF